MMAHDIFLSYARADVARAVQIKELLESLGLTVFFDIEGLDGGDVFPDVLDREVKSARAVVGVWSKHALTREWVKIECDIGRQRKVLVPVQIEEISFLDRPAAFHNIQYNDLSDFDGQPEHVGWLRFLRSLARVLNRPELLEREQAAQNATPDSEDRDVHAELAAMRQQIEEMTNAKAALAATVQDAQQDASAANYAIWQELKQTGNVDAVRRFLQTVRGSSLEIVVEAELTRLTNPVESAVPSRPAQIKPTKTENTAQRRLLLPVLGGLAAIGLAAFGFFLWQDGAPSQSSSELSEAVEPAIEQPIPDISTNLSSSASSLADSGVEYYMKACADGVAKACHDAGTALYYGEGIAADPAGALKYYEAGCLMKDAETCWVGGIAAEQGEQFNLALDLYATACKLGAEEGCELHKALKTMLTAAGD